MIDTAVEELSKLMVHLDRNPKKTRKDQNRLRKFQRNINLYCSLKNCELHNIVKYLIFKGSFYKFN